MNRNADIATFGDFFAIYKATESPARPFQHYHDAYEICFFIDVNQVNLEIFIKDTKYKIHDGDIMFINEYDIHGFVYKKPSVTYNRYVINFKREFILPTIQAAGMDEILVDLKSGNYTHVKTPIKEQAELKRLFQAIVKVYESQSPTLSDTFHQTRLKSYLLLILMQIWELQQNYQPKEQMNKTDIVDVYFDCGFNNIQHFYRVFKKISGITPDKYRKSFY